MELRYEGVTFFTEKCKKMSKAEFITAHLGIFWLDREEKTRRKMLGEVYDKIAPPAKAKSNN